MKLAIGDSFTYGEELADQSLAWPGLLGYENYGLPGASNEYIFRKAVELAPDASHMIVAWSDSARYELYTYNKINVAQRYNKHQGVIQVNPTWIKLNSWFKDLYAKYTDEQHQFAKTLLYMVALQDVLVANNVNYYFCSAFGNQELFVKYAGNTDIKLWTDRLNTDRFIGFPEYGFVEWAYGTPHGPNGHPLELGHKQIAEQISKHLTGS